MIRNYYKGKNLKIAENWMKLIMWLGFLAKIVYMHGNGFEPSNALSDGILSPVGLTTPQPVPARFRPRTTKQYLRFARYGVPRSAWLLV